MSYENPTSIGYTIRTAGLTGGAAALLTVKGPAGKKGRVIGMSASITTAVTVAAAAVTVGTDADANAYGEMTVPIATAGNTYQAADATLYNSDSNLIAADSEVVIGTDGAATAGAADVVVYVDWF